MSSFPRMRLQSVGMIVTLHRAQIAIQPKSIADRHNRQYVLTSDQPDFDIRNRQKI